MGRSIDTFKVKEKIAQAKDALLIALREAESRGMNKADIRKIEVLLGKAETLQNRI